MLAEIASLCFDRNLQTIFEIILQWLQKVENLINALIRSIYWDARPTITIIINFYYLYDDARSFKQSFKMSDKQTKIITGI